MEHLVGEVVPTLAILGNVAWQIKLDVPNSGEACSHLRRDDACDQEIHAARRRLGKALRHGAEPL